MTFVLIPQHQRRAGKLIIVAGQNDRFCRRGKITPWRPPAACCTERCFHKECRVLVIINEIATPVTTTTTEYVVNSENPPHDFQADIDNVRAIKAVPMILDVIARTTGMRFAAVARVTSDRWITCMSLDQIAFGLGPGDELDVKTTICDEIRASRTPVVIDHVAESPEFCAHHTPLQYGFQSYISMPIILADGSFFGTLCAIDPEPRKLNNPETIATFSLFAELISTQLAMQDALDDSVTSLIEEKELGAVREQFIAVLGHDLRNPVTSICSGSRLLKRLDLPAEAGRIVDLMESSALRMDGIIGNLQDFTRSRLGEGISLHRDCDAALKPMLSQVVGELESVAGPEIVCDFAFSDPVDCDAAKIGQLFSNLLGNAVQHGSRDVPVRVAARKIDSRFELSVENAGKPISRAQLDRLFEPFTRDGDRHEGLGLGLFIAAQIAQAHGGTLTACSTPERTRLVFSMPLKESVAP